MKNTLFNLLLLLFLIILTGVPRIVSAEEKTDNASHVLPKKEEINKNAELLSSQLSLEILIHEAFTHNPEIIAAQKRLHAAKARIPQAKSLDDPMFTAGAFEMSNSPVNINGESGMLEQRYGISQKIPFPGKLRLRGEIATEEYNIANQELQAKVQEITALVKNAFYEFFYIDRAIKVTEEVKELLYKFTKIAETKYKVGRTTQRDVLAAQVELSTLDNNLIVLNEQRVSVIARINTLLDRHPETALGAPRDFEKHTLDLTVRELEKIARGNRPELKQFSHAVKRSKKILALSKKDYYFPDFQPMVEYRQIDGRSDTWASTISINIPWPWQKNRYKVNESREDIHAAKSDYRFIMDKTLFEVKDFLVRIRSTESTVNLYKTRVIPDAKQTLESARIGYEADRVDFLTLIDSERLLLDAMLLYYRALSDFEQNLANMERAIGIQLTK